jgi:parallel beta-helix repeat protein
MAGLAMVLSILPSFAKSPSMLFAKDTVVTANIEIPDSATAIIQPGVTFRFSGYCKFIVRGVLIAGGTEDRPITFTCVDRVRGSTAQPCWFGMVIIGKNAFAQMRHCRMEGAYRNLAWESNPVFDSCEFVGNHCGLYCTKKAIPQVKRCSFRRNIYGIMADYANPMLLDNVITDNTVGVYLQTGAKLMAGKNMISGNQTNVKAESCLKGDTTASSVRDLWEVMNQLY